jgi:O-antigen ligase
VSVAAAQILWTSPESSRPARVAEVSLILGVAIAVLAFGGTERVSFAVVEVLFLLTGILLLVYPRRQSLSFARGIFWGPLAFIGWVLLQLCPLPISVASWIELVRGKGSGHAHYAALTIEPFATRVHLLILLTCIVGFFLAYIVAQDRRCKRHFAIAIIALGLFEAFYGFVQYLSGWQHIFGYVKKYDLEEATGTYINRNHYAGLLEMALPFALAFAAYEFGRFREKHPRLFNHLKRLAKRSSLQRLLFWLSVAAVIFGGMVCSKSRMGIISVLLSSSVMFALVSLSRVDRRIGLTLGSAFLVLSFGLAAWIGAGPIVERFEGMKQEYSSDDNTRLSIWRDSLHLIRRHPWAGTGLGTFPIAFTAVQTGFLGQFVNHAHNDYLELASDLGIPAALGLIAAMIWILARAVETFRIAESSLDRFLALGCTGSIAAILLHSFTDFNLYIPANCLVFVSILGLTLGLRLQQLRHSNPSR